jgi:hypothetical protein
MTYRQHKGLAMGAPPSSILSEFFLQYLENSRIYDLLGNHITGYFRYVDNILIIYNENTMNIEDLHCFNNLTPKLKFTLEKEMECKFNFLDLTIHSEHNSFSIDTYRKPTFTDTIIPSDSCHPKEHRQAATR